MRPNTTLLLQSLFVKILIRFCNISAQRLVNRAFNTVFLSKFSHKFYVNHKYCDHYTRTSNKIIIGQHVSFSSQTHNKTSPLCAQQRRCRLRPRSRYICRDGFPRDVQDRLIGVGRAAAHDSTCLLYFLPVPSVRHFN